MMDYEKPVVLANDEVAEGVYAASGADAADCWSVSVVSPQDWDGTAHVFEVHCVHTNTVEHISSASTVTLTFSNTLDANNSRAEFPCSVSGNTMTVTRTLLADAYKSGDTVTYKVWASTGDEATTRAIACTGATITCTKTVNVQGNGADGN